MNINDLRFSAFGNQGFTGSIDDRTLSWLKANGATSGNITDAWREMLKAQGAASSDVNSGWFELLGALGYVGDINDRERAFWADGGAFTAPLGQVDALIVSSTAPYLTGYDTSETPWASSSTPFGWELEGPVNFLVVNPTKTHFVVGLNVAPYLRLFTVLGVEVTLGTGSDFIEPIGRVDFNEVDDGLLVPSTSLDAIVKYNYLTGAYVGSFYSSGSQTISASSKIFKAPDEPLIAFIESGGLKIGYCSDTGGAIAQVNIPCNSANMAWTGNYVNYGTGASAAYRSYYSSGQVKMFDVSGSDVPALTGAPRSFVSNEQTTKGIIVTDAEVFTVTIQAAFPRRWTPRENYPVNWPADFSEAQDCAIASDGVTVLFSNGSLFSIAASLPVSLVGPSSVGPTGTACAFLT